MVEHETVADETVTVKLDTDEIDRLSETNIPTDVLEEVFERHQDVLREGIQRSAVVSKREVPLGVGHVFVWGDWP